MKPDERSPKDENILNPPPTLDTLIRDLLVAFGGREGGREGAAVVV